MEINLDPLSKAISSLEKAIQQPKDEFIRDAVIQRFEYTFELAWKMLKRYFDWNQSLKEYNIKNLFREAAKQKIIINLDSWFSFHEARNITTHTYDEVKADEIYELAKDFLSEVQFLSQNLNNLV